MEAFVELLRGINVGRGNRVPMAELRWLLERQGYRHVTTLLNSGSAVFCAPPKAGAVHGRISRLTIRCRSSEACNVSSGRASR